jgi:hypothetical protein
MSTEVKWPKRRELMGYRYDTGEHATRPASEWREMIPKGGTARNDGDGTVAIYNGDGRRIAEVYLR